MVRREHDDLYNSAQEQIRKVAITDSINRQHGHNCVLKVTSIPRDFQYETKLENTPFYEQQYNLHQEKPEAVSYWEEKYNRAWKLLINSKTLLETLQEKYRAEKSNLSRKAEKLEIEVKWLKAELDHEYLNRNKLQEKFEKLRCANDSSVKEANEKKERISSDKLKEQRQEITSLTSELEHLSQENSKLKSRTNELKQVNSSLQEDIHTLTKRYHDTQETIEKLRAEAEENNKKSVEQARVTKELALRCSEKIISLQEQLKRTSKVEKKDSNGLKTRISELNYEILELKRASKYLLAQLQRTERLTHQKDSLSNLAILAQNRENKVNGFNSAKVELLGKEGIDNCCKSSMESSKQDVSEIRSCERSLAKALFRESYYDLFEVSPDSLYFDEELEKAFEDKMSKSSSKSMQQLLIDGKYVLGNQEARSNYDAMLKTVHQLKTGFEGSLLLNSKAQFFKRKGLSKKPTKFSCNSDFSELHFYCHKGNDKAFKCLNVLKLDEVQSIQEAEVKGGPKKIIPAEGKVLSIRSTNDQLYIEMTDPSIRDMILKVLRVLCSKDIKNIKGELCEE